MGLGRFFRWFGLPGALVLTCLLSLLALILAGITPSIPRWLCAAGMLCSSLGDILLMNYHPITDRLPFRGFEAGAVSFMIAHGFYIAAFTTAAARRGKLLTPALCAGGVLFAALLALLLILHRRNARAKSGMTLLCIAYLAIISTCCTAVFTLAWHRGTAGLIAAVGALLFLASDAIIGFDRVGGIHIPHASDIIWWLYPLGQLGMIIGLGV